MSRASRSLAPDRDPTQEELLAQGTPGPVPQGPGGPSEGVWAVPPSLAPAAVSGCPKYGHAARPAPGPVPARSKLEHGGAGTATASGGGANPLPKPAWCLKLAQTQFLLTCSPPTVSLPPPPPSKDWDPAPAAECNSPPVLPVRARLLWQGWGCARVSPCRLVCQGWRHAWLCKRALSRWHGLLESLTG